MYINPLFQNIVAQNTDSPSLRGQLPRAIQHRVNEHPFIYKNHFIIFPDNLAPIIQYEDPFNPSRIKLKNRKAFIEEALQELYMQVYTDYCIPL